MSTQPCNLTSLGPSKETGGQTPQSLCAGKKLMLPVEKGESVRPASCRISRWHKLGSAGCTDIVTPLTLTNATTTSNGSLEELEVS
ncbi:hypothetical protein L2E82_22548 [Cichorium intybus]|uniref:Uncharacterized protein n=1 Tax=Cichorium intybus TaxID=13427 RepID=A0ACB9DYC4_CICIN|nr:hypothetical protein L2E82_22548 [Cichorium intybus]